MKEQLEKAIKENLLWFENSGVMEPVDGSWGVGERVVLTENNTALDKTLTNFPAHRLFDGYAVLEQRRPDCNFQTALLYLLAYQQFGNDKNLEISTNILEFLFSRSALLNIRDSNYPKGVWKFNSGQWTPTVYFDDNSWICAILMIISKLSQDSERKYIMRKKALTLAEAILDGFNTHLNIKEGDTPPFRWSGDLKSPHWGALACMAFAFAYRENEENKYIEAVEKYHDYLVGKNESFSSSEQAYNVIGFSVAAACMKNEKFTSIAKENSSYIVEKMDPETGNVPSQWGKEAPVGKHLVDLIYTQNWAILGLQALAELTGDEKHRAAFEKSLNLVVSIQDKTSEPHLQGCWRGMYDLKNRQWGGGDLYEGGANSIYTGWTNAPISICLLMELMGKSMISI